MLNSELKFLGSRMKQLREKNGVKSLEAMKERLTNSGNIGYRVDNRSTLSRAESGSAGEKTVIKWAKAYCDVFGYSQEQTNQFLRGDRIVFPDTSALLKNPQLIEELNEEYNAVFIADIVYKKIENIIYDSYYPEQVNKKANEIIKRINSDKRIIRTLDSKTTDPSLENNLFSIAENAVIKYKCEADIITDDATYPSTNDKIRIIYLRKYQSTKQGLINMTEYLKIQNSFSEEHFDQTSLSKEEINAFNDKGYTLLISTIYDDELSFEEKKEKINWLIQNGADINRKDCNNKYFPPLTHAILKDDYQMVEFLLKDCHANPNVASKSPYSTTELRRKNEGNVPLMVAAWEGRTECLKLLLTDTRISINQQDSNGFTALIKACANGETECRDLLLEANADKNIVDHDGNNYKDWYRMYLENGPLRDRFKSKASSV